jgi:hypothetical protein
MNAKHHTITKSACNQRGLRSCVPGAWNSKHRDGHKCVVDQLAPPSARHVASQRLQMHICSFHTLKKAARSRREEMERRGVDRGVVRDVHARKHGGT